MQRTLVLSANSRDTARWAAAQDDLRQRDVVHSVSAAAIEGLRVNRIVELPSFRTRRDRFAIDAAVTRIRRRSHNLEVERVEQQVVDSADVEKPAVEPDLDWAF